MIDPALSLPQHIAIIMDGNGRWAKQKGLSRLEGHKKGAEVVRQTVEQASQLGIPFLTLFAFSSENWKRPEEEVLGLMGLLRLYLKNELKKLHENKVKLKIIGDRSKLPADILELVETAEKTTQNNTKLCLNIALSYGGRQEITAACQRIAEKVKEGILNPDHINEALFAHYLYTAGQPDPDLLIRTSGEQRISNFLLWQIAYAEMVFLDIFWPDFTKEHLEESIAAFQKRERRYGQAKS